MAAKVTRITVDLTGYPNLVVIYLGMRVNSLRGLATLFGFGPKIKASVDAKPDGLLLHENFVFSLFPPHFGMRQYWRDFESLENWSRSMPHQGWWQKFVRDSGGTGFWHETYFMSGGMEAIYDDIPVPSGLAHFAPNTRRLAPCSPPGSAPSAAANHHYPRPREKKIRDRAMETINAARFKATCLALLDRVEQTGQPIRITRRGRPVARISPVAPSGKRRIMGCMEGTAKIVGDIESSAVAASAWEVLRSLIYFSIRRFGFGPSSIRNESKNV